MTALLTVLLAALAPQDESRLQEAWPKLVEVWKTADSFAPAPSQDAGDEILKVVGKLHVALEAADLYRTEGEYVPLAVKAFLKARFRGFLRGGNSSLTYKLQSSHVDPMKSFTDSIGRLQTLEKDKLDDEDNVQDELATARKALKGLNVTSDSTPNALRRRVLVLARALATGQPYPAPAVATPEQAKTIRDLIADLSGEEIEKRDGAMRDLTRIGEAAFPFLRDAAKGADAEAATRAKHLLGIGHAPWNVTQTLGAVDGKVQLVEELKMRAAAVELKRKADDKDREGK